MVQPLERRVAQMGLPGTGSGRPTREPSTIMSPAAWRGIHGVPGIADQMIRWHPRVAGHLRRIELAVQAANWIRRYEQDDGTPRAPTPREQAYLAATSGIWRRLRMDRSQNRAGWGTWRQFISTAFVWRHFYGFSNFEATWTPRWRNKDPWDLELFPVHPSLHERWLYAPDHSLAGAQLSGHTFWGTLPIGKCVLMPWHPEDGPEGRAELRALFFDIEAVAESKRGYVRRQSLAGGAVVAKVENDQADEAANKQHVLDTIETYEQGERGAMYVPRGFAIDVKFPEGTWESPVEMDKHVDARVDHVVGSWLATLGIGVNGSSALGNQLSVSDQVAFINVLREHGQALREVEELMRQALGFMDVETPVWTVDAVPIVDRAAEVARITSAVEAGLLPVTPALQAHVAELLGLPTPVIDAIVAQTGEIRA